MSGAKGMPVECEEEPKTFLIQHMTGRQIMKLFQQYQF